MVESALTAAEGNRRSMGSGMLIASHWLDLTAAWIRTNSYRHEGDNTSVVLRFDASDSSRVMVLSLEEVGRWLRWSMFDDRYLDAHQLPTARIAASRWNADYLIPKLSIDIPAATDKLPYLMAAHLVPLEAQMTETAFGDLADHVVTTGLRMFRFLQDDFGL